MKHSHFTRESLSQAICPVCGICLPTMPTGTQARSATREKY
jgi:hypothetical protein